MHRKHLTTRKLKHTVGGALLTCMTLASACGEQSYADGPEALAAPRVPLFAYVDAQSSLRYAWGSEAAAALRAQGMQFDSLLGYTANEAGDGLLACHVYRKTDGTASDVVSVRAATAQRLTSAGYESVASCGYLAAQGSIDAVALRLVALSGSDEYETAVDTVDRSESQSGDTEAWIYDRDPSADSLAPVGELRCGRTADFGTVKIVVGADGLAKLDDMILGKADAMQLWAPEADGTCVDNRTTAAIIAEPGRDVRWPLSVVPFSISTRFSAAQETDVRNAIEHWRARTNMHFVEVDAEHNGDFVRIVPHDSECNAEVGRDGGIQYVNLAPGCGFGSAVHEIGHAIGIRHEHQRPDRNSFVAVHWSNIPDDKEDNFERFTQSEVDQIDSYNYGSIMHYGPTAFGRSGAVTLSLPNGNALPAGTGQRSGLSALDISGANSMHRDDTEMAGGLGWGGGIPATSIAFGDVDGDGLEEMAIGRDANSNDRLFVFDGRPGHRLMFATGDGWGDGRHVTSLAFGNFDGTGGKELAIGRYSSTGARYIVYRFDTGTRTFSEIHSGGSGWSSSAYVTAVAAGDVNGDGRDELVVGRKASDNGRLFVLNDARSNFSLMRELGNNWSGAFYATSIAVGNLDGDSRAEIALTRYATSGGRVIVLDDASAGFPALLDTGSGWSSSHYGTSVAIGNLDSDSAGELVVGRYSDGGARWFVHDDRSAGFATLVTGGEGWSTSRHFRTSVAVGNMDSDGRNEIIIGRGTSGPDNINHRYFVVDDRLADFAGIFSGGTDQPDGPQSVTAVAAGRFTLTGPKKVGIAWANGSIRYSVHNVP